MRLSIIASDGGGDGRSRPSTVNACSARHTRMYVFVFPRRLFSIASTCPAECIGTPIAD